MKKSLLLLVPVMLLAITVPAQERDANREQSRVQEYLLFQDGKLYQVNGRTQQMLQERRTFSNGSMVDPDGTYRMQNGKQLRLRNGECLGVDGQRYANQRQFTRKNEMQARRNRPGNERMQTRQSSRRGDRTTQGGVHTRKQGGRSH
jgi:hypothetical protein